MDSRCVRPLTTFVPPASSMSYDDVISILKLRNKRSRQNYRMALSDFCDSCGVGVMSATKKDAMYYQNILSGRVAAGDMSLSSMNVRLYQLRSIYEHLGVPIFIFVSVPDTEHKKAGVDIAPSYFKDIRDNAPTSLYVLVRLAAECGLSVSEIASLTTFDISHVDTCIYVNGYFGKRSVKVPLDLFVELRRLCGASLDGKALFFGKRGKAMNIRALQRFLAEYSSYGFSELRNYALANMVKRGIDESKWQSYTGMIAHFQEYVSQEPYLKDSPFNYECALCG